MSKRFLTVSSRVCLVLGGVCGSVAAFGQDAPGRAAFEVASVKPAAPDTSGGPAKARAEEMMQEVLDQRMPGNLPKDRGRSRILSIKCWRTPAGKLPQLSIFGISHRKPCGPSARPTV